MLMLAFCLVTAALLIFGAGIYRRRIAEHGLLTLAWRWLTGQPHHGQPITDSGWWEPGTKALTPSGRARRWWYRPQRYRAAVRCSGTAVVLLLLWGVLYERTATIALVIAVSWCGEVLAVRGFLLWRRRRSHVRTWVGPAHLVTAPLLGLPASADPRSYLEIAPDRSRVAVTLPPDWNGDGPAKTRVVATLTAKLGIEAPEVKWALAGPNPHLEITQSAPPPAMVGLALALPAIEGARPDELVWGIGKKGAVVKSSLSGDSPHVGLSMGSGAGKSVTARSLLAQMLHRGAIGLVLDIKWISHMWADGLPNVAIARRPAEIHAALLWLGREVGRRNEVALAGADMDGRVHATVGPRLIVVAEELNATANALRSWWKAHRGKDDPVRSPALDALDGASFMGRQVETNLIYIGQRLSAKAVGSGDARENIGVICFGRYSPSNWKMLAGDFPMPPKSLQPGRVQIVTDTVRECQGILMTAAEARELATSGVVSPLPYGMPGARHDTGEAVSALAIDAAPDLGSATVSAPVSPSPVSGWVSLREAVEAGLLPGLTLAGARTARHRDDSFPSRIGRDGLAELYDPAALAAWAAQRKE